MEASSGCSGRRHCKPGRRCLVSESDPTRGNPRHSTPVNDRHQRCGMKKKNLYTEFLASFWCVLRRPCGPGSAVGIATAYGLNGPWIESLWGRDFPDLSRPALYNTYRVFPGGKVRPGG